MKCQVHCTALHCEVSCLAAGGLDPVWTLYGICRLGFVLYTEQQRSNSPLCTRTTGGLDFWPIIFTAHCTALYCPLLHRVLQEAFLSIVFSRTWDWPGDKKPSIILLGTQHYNLHPTYFTLHLAPCTLHNVPCTQNTIPCTLHCNPRRLLPVQCRLVDYPDNAALARPGQHKNF